LHLLCDALDDPRAQFVFKKERETETTRPHVLSSFHGAGRPIACKTRSVMIAPRVPCDASSRVAWTAARAVSSGVRASWIVIAGL
jgi:hypothetical protein